MLAFIADRCGLGTCSRPADPTRVANAPTAFTANPSEIDREEIVHLGRQICSSQAQIFERSRIYDRIGARRDLSLGEVDLDKALVGPPEAFAICNRRKLNSLCLNTRSVFALRTAGGASYVRRLCLPASHAD